MLSVDQALEKVLEHVGVLSAEERPILESLGQVLAGDIVSAVNIPPLDNSAMDGYAVRSEDTRGASPDSPRRLSVVGTVGAGAIARAEVRPGTAIRIMTGAPLPGAPTAWPGLSTPTSQSGRGPPRR